MPGGNYVLPIQMHYLLLQGANNKYFLLFWHEVSNENNEHRDTPISHPDIPVKVGFAANLNAPELYTYDSNFNYRKTGLNSGRDFTLQAKDTVFGARLYDGFYHYRTVQYRKCRLQRRRIRKW